MLKNFKLVHTEGLTGLRYEGRLIPFDKIDDAVAEKLYGKTHVLERVAAEPAASTTTEAEAEASATAALPEAATDGKKKDA